MKISIDKEYDVIPTWNGNEDDNAPIVFKCQSLTEPQREKVIKTAYVDGKAEVEFKKVVLFELAVKEIRNLEINGEAVTTAKRFIELPTPAGLFDEVIAEIAKRTMRQDVKNS